MKRTGSVSAVLAVLAIFLLPWPAPLPAAERGGAVHPSAVSGEKVNINTADVKQLMTLDGVGRKLAEKIVEHRKAHGAFTRPEGLRQVDGVAAGLWERNRERVVVK